MTDAAQPLSIPGYDFKLQSALNLGALEITTFASLALYGISLSQASVYFQRSSRDRLGFKIFVAMLLIVDTTHSVAASYTIYFDTVTQWNRAEANSIPLSTTVAFESIITFIVQLFFVQRIYRLSENTVITFSCFILSALRFVCAIFLSVEAFRDVPKVPNGRFVHSMSWLITTGLSLSAATDLLIAGFMMYYLRKLFSPYNLKSTTDALNRLIHGSLQTGLLTSITSMSVIISFQISMSTMVWFAIYIILAKLYSLSLLVSLNSRPFTRLDQQRSQILGNVLSTLHFAPREAPISVSHLHVQSMVPESDAYISSSENEFPVEVYSSKHTLDN